MRIELARPATSLVPDLQNDSAFDGEVKAERRCMIELQFTG
jgi:hypothetical protein